MQDAEKEVNTIPEVNQKAKDEVNQEPEQDVEQEAKDEVKHKRGRKIKYSNEEERMLARRKQQKAYRERKKNEGDKLKEEIERLKKEIEELEKRRQFSRTNPPRVIVPVNKNAVGAHNELLPSTEYELCSEGAKGNRVPVPTPHLVKQVKKSLVHQRRTQYEDPNRAKET